MRWSIFLLVAVLVAACEPSSELAVPDVVVPTTDVAAPDVSAEPDGVDAMESPETLSPPSCKPAPVLVHESDPDTTFRRGPYLQSVMDDSAVVVWMDAADGGDGCVDYAVDGGESQTVCAQPDGRGQYAITMDGLRPDATVTYSARVGELVAGPFTFHGAPANEHAVKLLVFADAHANSEVLGSISHAALVEGVHMAVGVGDLVDQPEEDQWDGFFEGLRALGHRVCFWPVIGNHERRHSSYFHHFVVPEAGPPVPPEYFYTARVGQVWFASMHIDDWTAYAVSQGTIESPGVAYLREAIQSDEAQSARWRLLFIHQPPWSFGWDSCDGYEGESTLREYLLPFAAEYGVAAMFFGHMHGYERGLVDGVTLVTTGGAGGALDHPCTHEGTWPEPWIAIYEHHYTIVDADCDSLTVTARDLTGETLDQFFISAP